MKIFACWCLLLCLPILSGCGDAERIGSASECFQDVFQQPPPSGVSHLQGEGDAYRSADIYLRFQVSKPVFLKLLGNKVHFVTRKGFNDGLGSGGNPPDWWRPLAQNPTVFATSSTGLRDPSYSQGNAYVSYDPVTQTAYVYSLAWD